MDICEGCGKRTRKPTRIESGQIVCPACLKELRPELATESQKEYARHLGISFSADITKDDISTLISRAKGEWDRVPASDEMKAKARSLGLTFSAHPTVEEINDLIREFNRAVRWVYSVCRHVTKADWVWFKDSGIDPALVQAMARELLNDPKLMDQIGEQDEGWSDRFEDLAEHIDPNMRDKWYFFGREGPSTRLSAYKAVASRIKVTG